MSVLSCAFTGHRPSRFKFGYDEEHPDCVRLKLVLTQKIQGLYDSGVTRFLSGCAQGVDLWAAEIVISMMEFNQDIELYCVIPFEEQAAKWTQNDRERYYTILEKSTFNKLISTRYTQDCYFKRNRYLVDHADILLAVYDIAEKGRSGTGYTVEYARQKGRGIITIHPDRGENSLIILKT